MAKLPQDISKSRTFLLSRAHGFSLLEVLIAFAIASIALGWFLYFLSEIHQIQSRARQKLLFLDRSWGQVLLQQAYLSREKIPKGELRLKEVPDEKIRGFFFVKLKKEGIWWKFLYFSLPKDLPTSTPSSSIKRIPTLPFEGSRGPSKDHFPLPSR